MRAARATLMMLATAGLMGACGCGGSGDSSSSADTQSELSTASSSTVTTAQPKKEPVELLGVTMTTATAGKPGAVVQALIPGDQSQLRPGDVIVAYNGKPVTGAQDLADAIGPVDLGGTYAITVVRGSKRFVLHEYQAGTTFLGVGAQDQEEGGKGALVVEVAPGSPAAKAGLQKGDLIVAVDDTAIENTNDLLEAVGVHSPGDEIRVSAERGSKDVTVTAKLIRRPAG